MSRLGDTSSEARFASFLTALAGVVGHADRAVPLRDYCTGLLMPAERKSVEPMAAVTAPSRVAAQHQSLLHFVGQSAWSDEAVLAKVRELTLPAVERSGPIEAWIIDDTSFPKKGRHSVGVTRQYSGQLGKQDNCQVAVSLSVATNAASLPVAYRLYLPQDWAADPARREKAGVPESVVFQAKTEIALDQYPGGCCGRDATWGRPHGCRLRGRYGPQNGRERAGDGLCGPGAAAHLRLDPQQPAPADQALVRPGAATNPSAPRLPPSAAISPGDRARVAGRRVDHDHVARGLSTDPLTSRFARLRVRAAHRDYQLGEPRPEEWLLVQWPPEEKGPTKYWLSTLPEDIPFDRLVALAKLRWRIERDYQELKQELGLGHYEGRSWRGFHHHAPAVSREMQPLSGKTYRLPCRPPLKDRSRPR